MTSKQIGWPRKTKIEVQRSHHLPSWKIQFPSSAATGKPHMSFSVVRLHSPASQPWNGWLAACRVLSPYWDLQGSVTPGIPYWKTIHLHVNLVESQPEQDFLVPNRFFIHTLIVIHIFLSQCRMAWVLRSSQDFITASVGFHHRHLCLSSAQTPVYSHQNRGRGSLNPENSSNNCQFLSFGY